MFVSQILFADSARKALRGPFIFWELIDALLSESLDKDLDQMCLFGLVLQDGVLKSSRLAGPDIAFSRTEIEDDLR